MARRRYQHPEPEKIGNWWYIRVRRDFFENGQRVRRQHREKLCNASKKIREVKKLADQYLESINQGLQNVGGGMTFSEYVDRHYTVTELPLLAKTTQDSYKAMIVRHLNPQFGELCFREIDALTLQTYFSGMRSNYPTRMKVKDALSSVMRSAAKYGIAGPNPMAGINILPDKRGRRKKPVISPEQFEQIISGIAEPYATMVFVAVWTGLRVSELSGLKWRCIGEDSITIEERHCRGDWSRTKTPMSAATIGAEPYVIERILALKVVTAMYRAGRAVRRVKIVRREGPDDLIFQSVKDGKPMREGNILRRHIKPAARSVGLDFVNWLCLRRSHATWFVQSGADPKSIQAQMRHSRISTTMDIYAQVVPEAQRIALRKLSQFARVTDVTLLSQKNRLSSESNGNEVVTIQ